MTRGIKMAGKKKSGCCIGIGVMAASGNDGRRRAHHGINIAPRGRSANIKMT